MALSEIYVVDHGALPSMVPSNIVEAIKMFPSLSNVRTFILHLDVG